MLLHALLLKESRLECLVCNSHRHFVCVEAVHLHFIRSANELTSAQLCLCDF